MNAQNDVSAQLNMNIILLNIGAPSGAFFNFREIYP